MTSESPHSKDGFSLFREASLSLADAFSLFQGVIITLLGLLLYGVFFGIIPFNSDGQLGLLLVLTSLQALALGQILGGQYRRTWVVMTIGIVFAGMGIVSCIVAGVLTDVIRTLLGLQNIITSVLFLALQLVVPTVHGMRSPPAEPVTLSPLMKRLFLTATVVMIVSIVFGLSMLAPLLLPSLIGLVGYALFFPVLLIILGLLTLYMTYINQKLQ
jgi:hypothetical protein